MHRPNRGRHYPNTHSAACSSGTFNASRDCRRKIISRLRGARRNRAKYRLVADKSALPHAYNKGRRLTLSTTTANGNRSTSLALRAIVAQITLLDTKGTRNNKGATTTLLCGIRLKSSTIKCNAAARNNHQTRPTCSSVIAYRHDRTIEGTASKQTATIHCRIVIHFRRIEMHRRSGLNRSAATTVPMSRVRVCIVALAN